MNLHFVKEPLLEKPIENWNNKDFVRYYSNKLLSNNGFGLNIPSDSWVCFIRRVKGFRTQMNLSTAEYKDFVDKVTDILFSKPGAVPAFGAIVSSKVYNMMAANKQAFANCTNDDFKKLRDTLLADKTLTFSLEGMHAECTN